MSAPTSESPRRVEFSHRGADISLLLPASADALIDDAAFARDERLPYWADLWPSAVALARHLVELHRPAPDLPGHSPAPPRPARAADPHALELGCGVGLVSLVLASCGRSVLATDFEPAALEWTSRNAARNGLILRTLLLDWRHPDPTAASPLVLGADVLYEARNAEALATALPVLVAPGGRALLADPGRRWLRPFLDRMDGAGWRVATIDRRRERGTAPGATESDVTIVELAAPAMPEPAGARGAPSSPAPLP